LGDTDNMVSFVNIVMGIFEYSKEWNKEANFEPSLFDTDL